MADPSADDARKALPHRAAVFVALAMGAIILMLGWRVLATASLDVASVTRAGEYSLISPRKSSGGLWVHVTGWIDGTAEMEIPGRPGGKVGPGNVDWRSDGDWAQNSATLKYLPRGVTTGHVRVEYRFR